MKWPFSRTPRADVRALEYQDFHGRPTEMDWSRVNADLALTESTVLACVRLLAATMATAPLHMHRRTDEGRERADDHPLARLLRFQPNPLQTPAEFFEQMHSWLELHGEAVAEVTRDGAGRVAGLWPMRPRTVTPVQEGGRLYYRVHTKAGVLEVAPERILHVRGMAGSNGPSGLDIIKAARRAVGIAGAAADSAGSFYERGMQPSGALAHPSALSEQAAKRLSDQWAKSYGGARNHHRMVVLEDGMTYTPISVDAQKSQLVEARKFSVEEVCRIFNVPPHLVQHLERATFSNIEHQAIQFVTHTIRPRAVRWEQRLNTLLSPADREAGYYLEFALDGLMRGDTTSRYGAYAVAIQNGFATRNEIRALENLPKLPGLDEIVTMPGASVANGANEPGDGAQEDTEE